MQLDTIQIDSEYGFPKVAMITNIPSPYREKTHVDLNSIFNLNYHVFYCAHLESNRLWKFDYGDYNKTFLKQSNLKYDKKVIYLNLDILKQLNYFSPDVVITAGFFPTAILAFIWCKLKRRKHIAFTDATIQSEENLSFAHKLIRIIVYYFTEAFIGASQKSLALYQNYKVDKSKLFLSPLCINNNIYEEARKIKKKYDLIFSGQFIDRKMPFFFAEVVRLVNEVLPCTVLLIGSGDLKDTLLNTLQNLNIDYTYPGYIQQNELPAKYGASKILIFPTKADPWGVVANEACAAGLPVITCENAGAANELIIHNYNGYVLPLNAKIWSDHIVKLLSDIDLYVKFSYNAIKSVQNYNYEAAVSGIKDAVRYVTVKV